MTSLTKELLSAMRSILDLSKQLGKPTVDHVTEEQLQRGYEVSKLASRQPQTVPITPLMANALSAFGDLKDGERLGVSTPETRAEKFFHQAMDLALHAYFPSTGNYDEDKPLTDFEHYCVQCRHNLKDNMRDVQEGQQEQREEAVVTYSAETSQDIVFKLLQNDPVFEKAVEVVFNMLPQVRASEDFVEINLPFMSKHSNVSAPYWQNDQNDAGDGQTYAQKTMDIAKSIKTAFELWKYNISTMYGRNQRGKGRLLIAVSRIVNLWLNRLEAVEIEQYRERSPLFVGYGDDLLLKQAFLRINEDTQRLGLKARNVDQSAFDAHVAKGFILLVGAMSILKANGQRSKEIAKIRAAFALTTILVDGLSNEAIIIFGRIFSGFIDTNRGGGIVSAIISAYNYMVQDKSWSRYCYETRYPMLVMGDDNLAVYKVFSKERMVNIMKKLGFEVNPAKDEFGITFLQYRLFEDPDTRELVMAYAFPRVVRPMLFKERPVGLGPTGWEISWWQQLFKLVECLRALKAAVNLVLPFDKNGLMLDVPIPEIISNIQKEDEERKAKDKHFVSTWEKIYDGDPQKERFMRELRAGNSGFLYDLQQKIKSAVDPDFYRSIGVRFPTIR